MKKLLYSIIVTGVATSILMMIMGFFPSMLLGYGILAGTILFLILFCVFMIALV